MGITQGMANRSEYRAFKQFRGHMVRINGLKHVLEQINSKLDDLASDGVHTVIFSDENMPGFMPGKRQAPFSSAMQMAEIIEALSLHHDIAILCVLREHISYLRSVHNYRLLRTDCGGFESFIRGLDLSRFVYAHLVKLMSTAAGTDSLVVVGFDDISRSHGRNVTSALAKLSGAAHLHELELTPSNTARSMIIVEVMRALNGAGILLPEKGPKAEFFKTLARVGDLAERTAEHDDRLFDILHRNASQHGFSITSERRLRAATSLARSALPMAHGRPHRKTVTHALDTAARRLAASRQDQDFARQLWTRFAEDRAEIAETWLPRWHDLEPPSG